MSELYSRNTWNNRTAHNFIPTAALQHWTTQDSVMPSPSAEGEESNCILITSYMSYCLCAGYTSWLDFWSLQPKEHRLQGWEYLNDFNASPGTWTGWGSWYCWHQHVAYPQHDGFIVIRLFMWWLSAPRIRWKLHGLWWLTLGSHIYLHISLTLLVKITTSLPKFKRQGHRPHFLMAHSSKEFVAMF